MGMLRPPTKLKRRRKNTRDEISRRKKLILVLLVSWPLKSIQQIILEERNRHNWTRFRSLAGTAIRKTTMQMTVQSVLSQKTSNSFGNLYINNWG